MSPKSNYTTLDCLQHECPLPYISEYLAMLGTVVYRSCGWVEYITAPFFDVLHRVFWKHRRQSTGKRLSILIHLESSESCVQSVWCLQQQGSASEVVSIICIVWGITGIYFHWPILQKKVSYIWLWYLLVYNSCEEHFEKNWFNFIISFSFDKCVYTYTYIILI